MVQVTAAPDCGNAPRKQVLRDFAVAMAEHDTDSLLSAVADDVEWEIVGRRTVRGKADFAAAVAAGVDRRAETLRMDSILTHGREGAVSSRLGLPGGGGLRCCDVYTFSGHGKTATIKRITSYWIEE
ncbi:nuclear transport factor 2 family protein [Nocardiopsis sp. RSe5-2]|uniref:Nuclear transport factor 2 family protein n=1 Tax=Nocardiopsis endophytica TaxID=3018445 RepID=A0ABT4U0Q4_9ACTN|nr:nuclear transport factor 2 family protein [Nocardiopsis endophytica]MDA2810533.1 nuclear transport factor 2 family protein [Nocardiopsis endophytica]